MASRMVDRRDKIQQLGEANPAPITDEPPDINGPVEVPEGYAEDLGDLSWRIWCAANDADELPWDALTPADRAPWVKAAAWMFANGIQMDGLPRLEVDELYLSQNARAGVGRYGKLAVRTITITLVDFFARFHGMAEAEEDQERPEPFSWQDHLIAHKLEGGTTDVQNAEG